MGRKSNSKRDAISNLGESVLALMPTRGIISSQVMDALTVEGVTHCLYTHDLPIPQSFNHLVDQALQTKFEYFWFVEEDTVVPLGGLQQMMDVGTQVTAINYPLRNYPDRISEGWIWGERIWVGLGCTMVKREVFELLPRPWFVGGFRLASQVHGHKDPVILLIPWKRQYGGQDLYFCYQVREHGLSLGVVEDLLCDHICPTNPEKADP